MQFAATTRADETRPFAIVQFARNAAKASALVSVGISKTLVKSLRAMMPKSPISRSKPPLAPLSRCFCGVPDNSAAGVKVNILWMFDNDVVDIKISVFALDGGPTIPSQTG